MFLTLAQALVSYERRKRVGSVGVLCRRDGLFESLSRLSTFVSIFFFFFFFFFFFRYALILILILLLLLLLLLLFLLLGVLDANALRRVRIDERPVEILRAQRTRSQRAFVRLQKFFCEYFYWRRHCVGGVGFLLLFLFLDEEEDIWDDAAVFFYLCLSFHLSLSLLRPSFFLVVVLRCVQVVSIVFLLLLLGRRRRLNRRLNRSEVVVKRD